MRTRNMKNHFSFNAFMIWTWNGLPLFLHLQTLTLTFSPAPGGAVSYVMKMVRRKWMRTDPSCIAQRSQPNIHPGDTLPDQVFFVHRLASTIPRSDGLALTTGDCGACSSGASAKASKAWAWFPTWLRGHVDKQPWHLRKPKAAPKW